MNRRSFLRNISTAFVAGAAVIAVASLPQAKTEPQFVELEAVQGENAQFHFAPLEVAESFDSGRYMYFDGKQYLMHGQNS